MTSNSLSDVSESSFQPDESTPLISSPSPTLYSDDDYGSYLARSYSDHDGIEVEGKIDSTMLPHRLQILLLCFTRIMEPMAFASIFPYVADMVQRNGDLHVSHVGFYSGLIESIFSATQAVFLIFWRVSASRWSHKRILALSLAGMAIGQVLYGLSTTIWQMILFRSITGVFSSSNLLIRMMIGELCTKKTQAKAFSWYSIAANVGIMFGPVIGGALADPKTQYPSIFKGLWFFEKYPFALPGIVVGLCSAMAALASIIFLEDSPTTYINHTTHDQPAEETQESPKTSALQLFTSPQTSSVLLSQAHIMVSWTAANALMPVIFFTPVALGGMSFSQMQITICISVLGACDTIWMLFVFPLLQRRIGTKGVMQTGSFAWPLFYVGFVTVNFLLRSENEEAKIAAFVLELFLALFGSSVGMSLTGAQLAVNEASPTSDILGKMNYVSELCSSLIRSIVPAICTAIFALGVRHHILYGHLALLVLLVFSLGLPLLLRKVKLN